MPLTDGPVTLLVVDDEEAIRNALRKFLAQQGYEVATAASGEEALEILQRQRITGILLDVNMPGISGVELVPQIMELEPTVAILMLTAVNDATSAALCMQRGAFDYLIKPIDLGHLGRAIHHALQRRHTQLEGQQINQWLKDEVTSRVTERRLELANQERISVATLEALVNALEAKDPYLRGHSARVADLCAAPGGKTTQLSESAEEVVAIEKHEGRARELEQNCKRLGAENVRVVHADALALPADLGEFDRVLLDAPCSGLGVLASRPDLRWRATPLPELQRDLLRAAAERAGDDRAAALHAECPVDRQPCGTSAGIAGREAFAEPLQLAK